MTSAYGSKKSSAGDPRGVFMYVCVCNSVRSSQVKEALHKGNHSVGALRRHFDFKTCCGACSGCMRSMIDEHTRSSCGGDRATD